MHILIAGSGISACVTAWYAIHAGHDVTLVSKGRDPRSQPRSEHHSATWNGAGGRFITPLEARPYADRTGVFERTVYEGGWLAQPFEDYSQTDQAWLRQRLGQASQSLSAAWDYYQTQGPKAIRYWRQWLQADPTLFQDVDLYDDNIVRLYEHDRLCELAVQEYQKADVSCYPVEVPVCFNTDNYAKALLTDGFTLNAQRFCINLLNSLDPSKLSMLWDTKVPSFRCNDHGEVLGMNCSQGMLEADSYVVLFGAYGSLRIDVAGVAGCWLGMPAPKTWQRALKIHGGGSVHHQAYDLSVMPLTHPLTKQTYLMVGGGYVFVGRPPYSDACLKALAHVEKSHREILAELFGNSQVVNSFRGSGLCIRAFTIDDLPVTQTLPCVGGGTALVKGGTNTGTASLAPVIAEEIMSACLAVGTRV